MRRTLRIAAASLLLSLAGSAAVLAAEEPIRTRTPLTGLAVSPARVEARVDPETSAFNAEISVTNRGVQAARVSVALNDLVVTGTGSYQAVPAGQTPYSLAPFAHVEVQELNLEPAGSPGAVASVRMAADLTELRQPAYGMLSVALEDSTDSLVDLGGIRVLPQVRPTLQVPIVLVPAQADGGSAVRGVDLGLQPVALSVFQRRQDGLLDGLLPLSLPGVADHGALVATARVENVGNAFGRAFTRFTFTGVNPLAMLPPSLTRAVGLQDRSFLEVEAAPAALMPGSAGETSTSSTYATGPDTEIDATPWFGFIRVRATTSLLLADLTSDAVVQETYVLVMPWKETLGILLLALLWRTARIRMRKLMQPRVRRPIEAVVLAEAEVAASPPAR